MAKKNILGLTTKQFKDLCLEHGLKGFVATQVLQWVFNKFIVDFEDMPNISKENRFKLAQHFDILPFKHFESLDSKEENAKKCMLTLHDGNIVECVILKERDYFTLCISSQCGCPVDCKFCLTGVAGFKRNLTSEEIIGQVLYANSIGCPISRLVFMGMGEPLANLDNLLPALELANQESGLGISSRRITISTVGIPQAIRRLADRSSHFHLAVSLHAPDDELRNRLVPVNRNIGLADLLAASDHYFEVSGRRLTFEYVLLAGINDNETHAHGLVRLLKRRSALLNVIPYNPVAGLPFQTPDRGALQRFRVILENGGLNVRFRRRKGDRINAACGQLRRSTSEPTRER